ncbi:MAG: DUF4124 domain-containing protein [Pseudomonadota bacterium]|nr:DUF4124 domain-containing protein [Pseudomonadota bacterium]
MASCWQPGRALVWILRIAAGLAALVVLVAPAAAQILKCTDGSGNVTYQNEPCPKSVTAGRVDIFDNSWTTDRTEKEAEWRRNAALHRVVTGMPLHWVRDALGEPAEVRDTATAGAAEVWLYAFPDRSVQVGILADRVLWFRETPVVGAVASISPEPARPVFDRALAEALRATPEPPRAAFDTPRSALASPSPADPARPVARGQDCRQALAALGRPDRQREVPPLDSSSDATTEYVYEPAGSASPTRTRVVCANGKVEGVDRTVVR